MKSVLMSIKPKYCELIANGKKTIEVRKNRPKLETPFKCYIYCTTSSYKGKYLHTSNKRGRLLFWENPNDTNITVQPENYNYMAYTCRGKVIGEFACNHITKIEVLSGGLWTGGAPNGDCVSVVERSALSPLEKKEYANGKEIVYGWHISDLKIYDEPKELSEFNKPCDFNYDCFLCDRAVYDKKVITDISGKITKVNNKFIACDDVITRPPQSWCYVEELRE